MADDFQGERFSVVFFTTDVEATYEAGLTLEALQNEDVWSL